MEIHRSITVTLTRSEIELAIKEWLSKEGFATEEINFDMDVNVSGLDENSYLVSATCDVKQIGNIDQEDDE